MTYKEKLQEEHPECVDSKEKGGCKGCPTDYDYEKGIHCHTVGDDCEACWNREIPGTESTIDYKVGDKFVIEIKEIDDFKNHMVLENIAVEIDMLDKLDRLDSDYVNEYFGELQEEAYSSGLEDAWKLATRIASAEKEGGLSSNTCFELFNTPLGGKILRENTYQEVLAKLEAYEKENAEIKRGNVIYSKTYNRELIVTCIDTEHKGVYGINSEGHTQWEDFSNLTKTDKHVDIENVLNQIEGVKI